MTDTFLLGVIFVEVFSFQHIGSASPSQLASRHRDAQAYIEMLENPARDSYQKPDEVLAALRLEAGEIVSDIGAGSGYFTFRLAQKVGQSGKIYAVEIDAEMVRHLNRRIRDEQVENVITILADPDDPLLPSGKMDRIFICNTWHHIEKQEKYLSLLKQALKPQGQVIMIDFKKKELPVGPRLEMKIAKSDLVEQMATAGFVLLQEYDFLPYQYLLVFQSNAD